MTTLLLCVLLACPVEEEIDDTWADPAAWGPWDVGSEERTFTSPTSGLLMPVQVWYPTTTDVTLTHLYDDLLEGQALDGTDPDCGETRPVLVFSHGNGGVRFQSIFLAEHLASHGFVVVAPDHVGNTFFDFGDVSTEELMFRRPTDVAETFDWLIAESDLSGCVDRDAGYALSGHSFGGYTTLAVAGALLDVETSATWCAETDEWLCDGVSEWAAVNPDESVADLSDPRVWAAVPMAPAGYEALLGGLEQIAVPTLVLGGDRDSLTSMDEQVGPLYEGLAVSPRHLGELVGADHFTFSNACELAPTYEGCNDPDGMGVETAHPLINSVTTAFLRQVLGDDRAGETLPPTDVSWHWTAE
jgi:predicted dienelactone hydrolase